MINVVEAARVTYVTQFCVSVTFSIPGHICDPILCICVYLCPIISRVTYVTQFCVSVCIRVSVTYIFDDKKHNVIHVTSVTLCPLVARVTYVTQFCVSVCICVSVTQKQNFTKTRSVIHVTL